MAVAAERAMADGRELTTGRATAFGDGQRWRRFSDEWGMNKGFALEECSGIGGAAGYEDGALASSIGKGRR
ncbi:unnamed protein product [Calypogeia fissa]